MVRATLVGESRKRKLSFYSLLNELFIVPQLVEISKILNLNEKVVKFRQAGNISIS